jgi:hypothetical protein
MTMIAYAFLQHRRPSSNSAEKKESTGRRLNRLCPPCATPSSNSSLDYRRSDARIAENGSAASSGVSKSAKVVLGSSADSIGSSFFRAVTCANRGAKKSCEFMCNISATLAGHRVGAAGLLAAVFGHDEQGAQHPHSASTQAALFRKPQAAEDAGPPLLAQAYGSGDADRSRALRRRFLGRLEPPLQPKEPLLEELVAQIG